MTVTVCLHCTEVGRITSEAYSLQPADLRNAKQLWAALDAAGLQPEVPMIRYHTWVPTPSLSQVCAGCSHVSLRQRCSMLGRDLARFHERHFASSALIGLRACSTSCSAPQPSVTVHLCMQAPTLVLAECVLVYMDASDAAAAIAAMGRLLPSAVFIVYEQVNAKPVYEYAEQL